MISSVRQSMVNLYCHCQEAFRRRYIEGEIIPPAIAMAVGTGVHKAAETNHKQKINTGMDMRIDEILDAAADGFQTEVEQNGVYFTGSRSELNKELGKAQDLSINLAALYGKKIAPAIMPVAAELKIEAQHPDLPIPFSGTIDVVTQKSIIDLKTARVKWRAGKEKETVQPEIYRFMLRENDGHDYDFGFHVMAYTGETQYIPVKKSNQEMGYVVGIVKAMLNSIKTGCFMAAVPGHWICADGGKFCGFWHTCKARRR